MGFCPYFLQAHVSEGTLDSPTPGLVGAREDARTRTTLLCCSCAFLLVPLVPSFMVGIVVVVPLPKEELEEEEDGEDGGEGEEGLGT